MSEVPSPDTASSSVAHSGTSTPTKGEPISDEADAASEAAESNDVDTNRFSAQLSPTSTEAHTVYHSLPSTPAP
ncbi:hypothetical protein NUW54_g13392 [Trametes sanguinea]|uniref:Uncharacterized protein n=1 Tax=Trametes sanguinea TaxID=158606 RepID=A0ACC1MLI3_9APHY|nr:hypothetical protein NUW54_g13392 [Trametes sanguinea]